MKVRIKKISRKHTELYVDDKLAATARNLNELEQQIRIMKMMAEIKELFGLVEGSLGKR